MHTPLPSGAKPATVAVGLALLAVYLIWGSTYLAIAVAIETMPPFLMAGLRFLLAGGALYAVLRLRGAPTPSLLHWRSAALVGGLLLLGGNGGVVWAEQHVPSGLTALIIAVVPLWMALLAWAQPGGLKPTRATALGIALGLVGLLVLVGPGRIAGAAGVDLLGAGVLMVATFSWALGSVHSKRLPLPASALQATAMEMLAGGLLLTLVGTGFGEWSRFDVAAVSTRSWVALAYLVVFGSLVAFSCYVWLLRATTPAVVSTYAMVNPVVAVALGALLLAEPLTGRTLLAAAVIVAGVGLITQTQSAQARAAAARRARAVYRRLRHGRRAAYPR